MYSTKSNAQLTHLLSQLLTLKAKKEAEYMAHIQQIENFICHYTQGEMFFPVEYNNKAYECQKIIMGIDVQIYRINNIIELRNDKSARMMKVEEER